MAVSSSMDRSRRNSVASASVVLLKLISGILISSLEIVLAFLSGISFWANVSGLEKRRRRRARERMILGIMFVDLGW